MGVNGMRDSAGPLLVAVLEKEGMRAISLVLLLLCPGNVMSPLELRFELRRGTAGIGGRLLLLLALAVVTDDAEREGRWMLPAGTMGARRGGPPSFVEACRMGDRRSASEEGM